MWSYVQYRRIGRSVAREWAQNHSLKEKYQQEDSNDSPDVEVGLKSEGEEHDDSKVTPSQAKSKEASTSSDKPSAEPRQHHQQEKKELIIVRADGDDDILDPKNWTELARSKNIAVLSLLIFTQAWAGAAESMGSTSITREFHVSKVAENLSTAMYLFGIGTGCMFAGPLSETFGRNPTYLVATFFYLIFVLASALAPNFGAQIIFRYLVGLFASATLGINGASVGDQFRPVKRAFVFPVIAWMNVAAPVIAPIAGGWIAADKSLNWRWMEWVTLILSSTAFLIAFFFLPETYFPLILDWKARQIRNLTGDSRYVSEYSQQASFFKRMRQILPLPAKFLATEPVITVLGGYLVLLYILLFSFLSGFDYIFRQTYKLSDGFTGSCFGAIAAGATSFLFTAPLLYKWARSKTEYVHGAPVKPEFRLWPAIFAAPFLPICLFWLGWSNYSTISIWSGLGACYIFGIVLIALYVASYEYIIDSYGDHAAIGLASITMCRYLIAGGMVVAVRPMYEGIGVHYTMTFLGCIATVLTPAPFIFHKYGHKLRKKSPYATSDVNA